MKIYFVRHGHPDYNTDSLTELGKKQAQAAAERLKNCDIERIFASSKGRAIQTAEYTADKLGLEVIQCDFIREIGWGSIDGEPMYGNGQPWAISERYVSEGKGIANKDWQTADLFNNNVVVSSYQTVADGIDSWLSELGYKREGDYYRVAENIPYETVTMFSHAGSSTAALSHMFNIPFPQLCGIIDIACTSITVVELSNERGALVSPRFRLLNDAKHTEGLSVKNFYGN